MRCIDCKHMEYVGNDLYVCTNENSENWGEYTGICCEDDCEDGEEELYEWDIRLFIARREIS